MCTRFLWCQLVSFNSFNHKRRGCQDSQRRVVYSSITPDKIDLTSFSVCRDPFGSSRLTPSYLPFPPSFPLFILFPLCNHWGAGLPLPLNASLTKEQSFLLTHAASIFCFWLCLCLSPCLTACLSVAFPSRSVCITWLISLSSLIFLPDSFYISQRWPSEASSGVVWSE